MIDIKKYCPVCTDKYNKKFNENTETRTCVGCPRYYRILSGEIKIIKCKCGWETFEQVEICEKCGNKIEE